MNFQKAEQALEYLRESESELARLKAGHQAEKERLKIVLASLQLDAPESTQAGKERWALASEEYKQALTDWQDFMEAFYEVEAKRKRAELTIEMWRSYNSAQSKGLIT